MSKVAVLIKRLGYYVTGSDKGVYPPASTILEKEGIKVLKGFNTNNLIPHPDLVVVGNAVPKSNPEAVYAEEKNLKIVSMPEVIRKFIIRERKSIVVTGTHGKTTTTAMISFVLQTLGYKPGYLIGSDTSWDDGFSLGEGELFVIEGDEYNTSYFDRHAKFLHYNPYIAVINNIEYDHSDIFANLENVKSEFESLIKLVPQEGSIVYWIDDPNVRDVVESVNKTKLSFGYRSDADLVIVRKKNGAFIFKQGNRSYPVKLGLFGEHNVRNAAATTLTLYYLGVPIERTLEVLRDFRGVKRRLEIVGEIRGNLLVSDFAHHPTEVLASIKALKENFKGRNIVVAFEPRTVSSSRSIFFDDYLKAFSLADTVILAPPYYRFRFKGQELLDTKSLAQRLCKLGIRAISFSSVAQLKKFVESNFEKFAPAVMAFLSSGDFSNYPFELFKRLK